MSAFRRPTVFTLILGIILTGGFLFFLFFLSAPPTARATHGRLFGMLGFAAAISASLSPLWEPRKAAEVQWGTWHNALGFLALWLILLHCHFHLGSGIARLAFLMLLLVGASGVLITWMRRSSSVPSPQGSPLHRSSPAISSAQVRQEWVVLLHIGLTIGLFTFSLFHILAIFYY